MPERIPAGVAKTVVFRAISSTDHFTPKISVSPVITIWETGDGAAFKNPAAGATTATEIASGFYKFTLGTTDVNVVGPMAWRAAVSGMDDVGDVYEVVNATNAGFSALPDVASGSAGAVIISGTGTAALSVTSGLVTLAAVTHTGAVVPTVTAVTNEAAKYMHGAVWIDTVNGAAGTTSYTNGIATNPSSSIASAKTIADNLKLKRFWIQSGSSITMAAAYVGYVFTGAGYVLALGGQDISKAIIENVEGLSGTGICTTGEAIISKCHLNAVTIGEVDFNDCHLMGTVTMSQATVPYLFNKCTGVTAAKITFAAANQSAVISKWSGALTIAGMVSTNTLYLDGDGDVTFDNTNNTGTVYINGNIRLTNSGTSMAITDTSRWGEDQTIAVATTVAANGITATSIAADAINAASVKADAVTKIQNGLATPTNITAGVITTVTNLTNAPTNGDLTATMKTSVTTAATAATPIAASVTGAVGSVTGAVGSVAANGITATSIAADAINAAAVKADAVTKIQNGLATPTNITAAAGIAVTSIGANVITAASMNADASTEIATTILATAVDGTTTWAESVRLANSALGGKASGLNTTTAVYRDLADTKDRISATVDADGNRSAVTRTLT